MRTTHSNTFYKKAQQLIPGGVNSPVRSWNSVGGQPIFISHAQGSTITDVDENTFIDYVCSWGPLLLGHADPDVIHAISRTAQSGTTFGAPHPLEIKLAEQIINAMPSLEMIRFVNSGTEATMSAIRVARAFTKRDKIIKFIGGYHGHADFLLAKAGSGMITFGLPDSAGVPKQLTETTLLAQYNNIQAVEKLFHIYPEEIAAVIVEPIAGNMGVVIPEKSFLKNLQKITTFHRSLLIFDEVITGFRVAWGGAQTMYGIEPDLTCLGKIIGGGLPVGAYGGKRNIMQMIAPIGPVYQAGTLSGNPLAMAAGIATLEKISKRKNTYIQLEKKTAILEQGLHNAAKKAQVNIQINRVGSMMTIFFTDKPVTDYTTAQHANTKQYAKFFHSMLAKEIYFPPSQCESLFLSLAHSHYDIEKTIHIAQDVFYSLR